MDWKSPTCRSSETLSGSSWSSSEPSPARLSHRPVPFHSLVLHTLSLPSSASSICPLSTISLFMTLPIHSNPQIRLRAGCNVVSSSREQR